MKIVIAAWHLKDFNVGLARYCWGLIDALGRVDSENRYEILIPDGRIHFPDRPNFHYRVIRFPLFKRRLWEQLAPLLVGPYDILHFPHDSSVIWKRGKFLVTIHDVKPLLFPLSSRSWNMNRRIQRMVVPDRCKQADQILTISQCSRRDLIERLGVRPERISVVYPGVDLEKFKPIGDNQGNEKGQRPFILSVAGGDPTKNLEVLIQAFSLLSPFVRERYNLVLAGDLRRRGDLRQLVDQMGLEKYVVFTGTVSDERLVELYQQASVFVYPSLYEGFGLPVLEAMACGCPVICSNRSTLPEVVDDAGVLVDPTEPKILSVAIEEVLANTPYRRRLREKGLDRVRRFSWDRTASELLTVYQRVSQLN